MRSSALIIAASAIALLAAGPAPAAENVKCAGMGADVIGTPGRDRYEAGDLRDGDVVATRGGNDNVEIKAENVTVCAGDGYDNVTATDSGGEGAVIYGGNRRDTLGGSIHRLILFGGDGPDFIAGSDRNDEIDGGAGRDYIHSEGGRDVVRSRGGDDWIQGGLGFDVMFGGRGNDSLFGLEFDVPARKDKNDKGDGGKGSDYCQTAQRHSCGRKHRTDIPL